MIYHLFVNSKEIVGLLGPNGAGKTTSFYMVCGLTDATDGEVFLDGDKYHKTAFEQTCPNGHRVLASGVKYL